MKNRPISKLFERVKMAGKQLTGKTYGLASAIGVNELTFKGYCSEVREGNLWPLLPDILAAFPEISREWLYFNEGEMLVAESATSSSVTPTEMRGKLRMHPRYPDDPLGRIEMLVNVPNDPLKLQTVFGADYKELKPFTARYYNARQEWAAWRAAGSREEDVPDTELPRIPEEWLDHFWRHYGPSPEWIRYGGGEHDQGVLLEPRPGMAETERLRGEVAALREETERLRQELAAAHEKNAHLEVHEEEAQRLRDEAGQLRQELADAREKNVRLEVHEEEVQRLREEAEHLRQELAAAYEKNARLEVHEEEAQRLREETEHLRQELAAAHTRLGSREAQHEDSTPPDKSGGSRAPLPPDANATPSGGE